MSGSGWNVGAGYWFGMGQTFNGNFTATATEVGIVSPQAGVSYHYSWDVGNLDFKW